MELREFVEVLRRQKWLILQAGLVLAIAAGVLSGVRTPMYRGTALVLLRPNDPNEQLNPANGDRAVSVDPNRYAVAQQGIVESEAVAREAAKLLRGTSVAEIERRVSVRQAGQSDILRISAVGPDPDTVRDIANAVAKGYIENRRNSAVEGLQKAADDIDTKLAPLQARIEELDAQISGGQAAQPVASVASVPQGPTVPASPQPDPPAAPTTEPPRALEAVKAARYAADVQYTTLYQRQQELLADISLKRGEAELISLAKTPTSPFSPRPLRDAALGAFLGLVLGTGIGFLREQLDDRVRSVADVERASDLPVLAQLPYEDESTGAADVAAVARPVAPLAEAVRSLRTSVQFLGLDPAIRVIAVTSAVPGEGKSLVAANLAAVYAQAGYTTYLVSGDLRRPGLVELFGIPIAAAGLSDAIDNKRVNDHNGHGSSGQRAVLDLLAATSIPNLFVLPSGAVPANPSELVGSRRMSDVLGELSRAADVVVIDTPPLLPVTDGAVLGAKADGVLLVVALHDTSTEAVRRAKRVLAATGARLVGAVVNKAPSTGRTAYGSYQGYYAMTEPRRRFGRRTRAADLALNGPLSPVSLEPDPGASAAAAPVVAIDGVQAPAGSNGNGNAIGNANGARTHDDRPAGI